MVRKKIVSDFDQTQRLPSSGSKKQEASARSAIPDLVWEKCARNRCQKSCKSARNAVFQRQFDPEVSRSEEVPSLNSTLFKRAKLAAQKHAEEKRRLCMVFARVSACQSSSPVGRAADVGTTGAGSSPGTGKNIFLQFLHVIGRKEAFVIIPYIWHFSLTSQLYCRLSILRGRFYEGRLEKNQQNASPAEMIWDRGRVR